MDFAYRSESPSWKSFLELAAERTIEIETDVTQRTLTLEQNGRDDNENQTPLKASAYIFHVVVWWKWRQLAERNSSYERNEFSRARYE